ncbi:hypothetical protein [Streptomyces sp. Ru62]|uniref:hypothetical protein n=1 Tax=Streptomyces sp. Ru62 TaxID=2080745 RepID=UPI0015E40CBB|nr:hypothetical protein [Streptomyces sp. Ru62]
MTDGRGGLPYEECKRRQREDPAPRDRTTTPPAYALPPFHPAFHPGVRAVPGPTGPAPAPGSPPRPRRRPRRRVPDGAAVSGFLAALCVGALLAAIGLAAVRRC